MADAVMVFQATVKDAYNFGLEVGKDYGRAMERSRHSRLVELVTKARTEGWYDGDPAWEPIDKALGVQR